MVTVRFNAVLDSTVSGQALSLATTFKLLKLLRNCHLKFRLPAGKSFLTRSRQAQEGLAPALGCQFLTIASASLQAYNYVTPCLIPCTRSQCTNSSIKRGAKELEVIATYLRDSESDDTKPPKCQSGTTQKRYQKIIEKPSLQLPFGTFWYLLHQWIPKIHLLYEGSSMLPQLRVLEARNRSIASDHLSNGPAVQRSMVHSWHQLALLQLCQ